MLFSNSISMMIHIVNVAYNIAGTIRLGEHVIYHRYIHC